MTQDQLVRLIQSRELSRQDEICPANGYWMFLNEIEEVKKYLGIVPPEPKPNDDEAEAETETITQFREEPTDVPELESVEVSEEEMKQLKNNEALKRFHYQRSRQKKQQPSTSHQHITPETKGVETYSLWKWIVLALAIIGIAFFVSIFKTLRSIP